MEEIGVDGLSPRSLIFVCLSVKLWHEADRMERKYNLTK